MKLIVNHIKKAYRGKPILRDISFEAKEGECIGLVGKNGCGKTTLLSVLTGVERADGGSISLNGRTLKTGGGINSGLVGYVPQTDPLPETLTVGDCLRLWCSDKETYRRIAERYNLNEIKKKRIKHLSGGMKRRTSIACSMAKNPEILVMDEPTAGLDIEYKSLIHEDMREFVGNGGLLIMVTHEKEEMLMCSSCYELVSGELKKYDMDA